MAMHRFGHPAPREVFEPQLRLCNTDLKNPCKAAEQYRCYNSVTMQSHADLFRNRNICNEQRKQEFSESQWHVVKLAEMLPGTNYGMLAGATTVKLTGKCLNRSHAEMVQSKFEAANKCVAYYQYTFSAGRSEQTSRTA